MTGSFGLAWLHRLRSISGNVACFLLSRPGRKKPPLKISWPLILYRVGAPWLLVSGAWEGPGRAWKKMFWWLQTISPGMPRLMLQRPKLPKWLLKPYWTSSLPTMGYPKRSSWIKAITLRVSWWLTSVSWWEHRKCGLVHTICRPTASVRDLIPFWSICLGHYPRRRSQNGKITLEHWSMHITVPKTKPQGSAPTSSCSGGSLISLSMLPLVWLHEPSWSQILPNSCRK